MDIVRALSGTPMVAKQDMSVPVKFGIEMECILNVPAHVFNARNRVLKEAPVEVNLGNTLDSPRKWSQLVDLLNTSTDRARFVLSRNKGEVYHFEPSKGYPPLWIVDADGTVMIEWPARLGTRTVLMNEETYGQHTQRTNCPAMLIEGIELISPVFRAEDRMWLGGLPADMIMHNVNTSNHIHMSSPLLKDPQVLIRLIVNYRLFEPVVMAMCAKERRHSYHCQMQPFWSIIAILLNEDMLSMTVDRFCDAFDGKLAQITLQDIVQANARVCTNLSNTPQSSKKQSLNLNFAEDGHLEFRIKHGSADALENCMFVDLFSRIVRASVCDNACTRLLAQQGGSRRMREYLTEWGASPTMQMPCETVRPLAESMIQWVSNFGDDASTTADMAQFVRNKLSRNLRGLTHVQAGVVDLSDSGTDTDTEALGGAPIHSNATIRAVLTVAASATVTLALILTTGCPSR